MKRSLSNSRRILALSAMAVAAGVSFCLAAPASAAMNAADNASNYTGTTWPNGGTPPNAGSGFGAWTISTQNNSGPPYTGTYFNTNNVSIATSSDAWGTYANSGSPTATPRVDLYRAFTGSLSVGQTFSVALTSSGVGSYPPNGMPAYGFGLGSAAPSLTAGTVAVTTGNGGQTSATNYNDANSLFSLTFNELGSPTNNTSGNLVGYNGQTGSASAGSYILETNVTANGVTTSSISGLTDAQLNSGVMANFTLGAGNNYSLTLTSLGATPTTLATYNGTLAAGAINGADLFDQNTYQDGLFNSLAITTATPEPASLALIGISGAVLLLARRRKMA